MEIEDDCLTDKIHICQGYYNIIFYMYRNIISLVCPVFVTG